MSLKGFLRWQDFLDSYGRPPDPPHVPYNLSFALAFSPDGHTLATRTEDGVGLWDVKAKRLLRFLPAPGGWHSTVAFTADGRRLISAGGRRHHTKSEFHQGEIRIWDSASGQLLQALWAHPKRVISAIPSPDGTMLVSSGMERTLRLWKLGASHAEIERSLPPDYHTNILSDHWQVRISPDGRTLATGDSHGGNTIGVGRVDIETGQPLKFLNAGGPFAFSPDNSLLATSGKFDSQDPREAMSPQLWDTATSERKMQLTGHPMVIGEMAFSPDGRYLACVGWRNDAQGMVIAGELVVWDLKTQTLKYVRESHKDHVHTIAISPDGKVIATGGQNDDIRLWETQTGRLITVLSYTVR